VEEHELVAVRVADHELAIAGGPLLRLALGRKMDIPAATPERRGGKQRYVMV
jgi:hypothetical protein